MLFESFIGIFAFFMSAVGITVAFLPHVDVALGSNKEYLVFAKNVCSITVIAWLVVSLVAPGFTWAAHLFVAFVATLFYWLTLHFNEKIADLKE